MSHSIASKMVHKAEKTTLRSFQTEIEDIHSRELLKQRQTGATAMVKEKQPTSKAKDKDKEKQTTSKAKDKDGPKTKVVPKPPSDQPTDVAAEALQVPKSVDFAEQEEQIITLLLSRAPANYERARDSIAALITQNGGEYLVRLGAQPPAAKLLDRSLTDEMDGWTGQERTQEDIEFLHTKFVEAVEEIGGKLSVLVEVKTGHPRLATLLRILPPDISLTPEVRCAVVGNVDSGKSTTLGVLTRGGLDDGRGKARVALFRHKHEIESGRTSSVGLEILGFGPDSQPILPRSHQDAEGHRIEKLGWEEISLQSAKIVSFIDLAGHERYLKTTLYGLTSGAPSCIVLTVGANAGLIGMSKEHLAIALALGVPIVVCITKIDMAPRNVLENTTGQVVKILKSPGCHMQPVFVESTEAAVEIGAGFGRRGSHAATKRICPIFQISNVTGDGIDRLRVFLNLLPSSEGDKDKFASDQPLEVSITEVWSVPYVGTVVNGIVNNGFAKVGDHVLFGPDSNGNWTPTMIKDMQRKRVSVTTADAGQCVSFALKRVKRETVRKGMVLVHKSDTPPKAVRRFEGQVLILYHNTTMEKNYQAMLHCGAVRQTVRIVGMDDPSGILRTGDRATVTFEFISHPEFVKQGMKLLFREGKTKGLGVITKIL